MNCEIISVGTELLLGQIVNTDSQYISEKLAGLGINVFFHTVVGDNKQRLLQAIKIAYERSDLIITTGGLGPTMDDLTKETVFEFLGLESVIHPISLEKIKNYFKSINRKMTQSNIKQAMFPEQAIILENDNGTAPGAIIKHKHKTFVILPGPPQELQPMFEKKVIPQLFNKDDLSIKSRVLKIFGIGESSVEEKIKDLLVSQTNPTIAPLAKSSEVTLRITARCKPEEHKALIDPVEKEIRRRLGSAVYGTNEQTLQSVAVSNLIEKNLTLVTAESCTGGMLASMITEIPGASNIYHGGLITYSNEFKNKILGVKRDTLNKFGAVSKECAVEMAEGAKKIHDADIAVSITGIAGPGGATINKPVGLVYIGLSTKQGTIYKKFNFTGNRQRIRLLSCMWALNMIRLQLTEDNI
ncbi:MAG: competence/damage-inducible protein A [Clostridia bacterium]|nr:competence/damage-inducible protein A [Clostridia bacterium]